MIVKLDNNAMNYILSIRTTATPHPFEIGYSSKAAAEEAIFKAFDNGYFLTEDYACILGPGVSLRLYAEDVARHEDTFATHNISHYIIVTTRGQMIALDFTNELSMKIALSNILKHKCFKQTFKNGRDMVYLFVEPGTTLVMLTAEAYRALTAEVNLESAGNSGRKIVLS